MKVLKRIVIAFILVAIATVTIIFIKSGGNIKYPNKEISDLVIQLNEDEEKARDKYLGKDISVTGIIGINFVGITTLNESDVSDSSHIICITTDIDMSGIESGDTVTIMGTVTTVDPVFGIVIDADGIKLVSE